MFSKPFCKPGAGRVWLSAKFVQARIVDAHGGRVDLSENMFICNLSNR